MLLLPWTLAAHAEPARPVAPAVQAHVERLIAEVGPRAFPSEGSAAAQTWVAEALSAAGWTPRALDGAVVACRPGSASERVVLFLAHTDAVHPEVPGANDNAAAVGMLLEAARILVPRDTPRRVCLGFPDGEEVGLLGSRRLAATPGVLGGPLDLVVSLDVAGRGEPTWNGLGPAMGAARLSALLDAAPASVPWVYRALSEGRPHMERSDHAPFATEGVPSAHWMARSEGGVDWAYHTPADTPGRLQAATLRAGVDMVVGLAQAPPLPDEDGGPAFVVPGTTWVVSGAVARVAAGLGSALALLGIAAPAGAAGRWGSASARALVAGIAAAVALALAGAAGPWHAARAAPVLAAAWAAWVAAAAAWPWDLREREARGVGIGVGLGLAALLAWVDLPLLALPMVAVAAAAAATAWSPARPVAGLLALVPALYLVRPDAVRELAFHGLVPATAPVWGVLLTVLAAPGLAAVQVRRPRLALVAAGASVLFVVLAWGGPTFAPPFVERAELPPWGWTRGGQ